ncbi:hypothetical protein GCM10010495_43810 [Kitasatospora herbaricolor]|uniref:4'-phosphopantetheinyl transferase superfamily protein n=1 Tax=Kitasatospora herbaricolor TaxID=68217 RepID=UPI0019BAB6AE|nr:4'-phosphopantetheinyl transferase superfamily protein [Kitasatospora herbaricolor]MDQ0306074.1 4'-phosphopantetheinyl transferase EntD [Kitasatospora herbaricolor]GGV23500.1 hypothetical protein GCM10010495_43810 [Kitasatospora herbaricolor]
MLSPRDRAAAERRLLALRPVLAARGLWLGVAAGEPTAAPGGPGEERLAALMQPGRRLDFLAGRRAARRALAAAGLPVREIPAAGRRPVFPPGCAGSISHSGGLAVAVVARTGNRPAVGCDLEFRGLPAAAAHLVLSRDEQDWMLRAAGPAECERRLLVAFSAKEAAFKAFGALLPVSEAPAGVAGVALLPVPGGFRSWPRRSPHRVLAVAVHRVGPGVLSWTAAVAV